MIKANNYEGVKSVSFIGQSRCKVTRSRLGGQVMGRRSAAIRTRNPAKEHSKVDLRKHACPQGQNTDLLSHIYTWIVLGTKN